MFFSVSNLETGEISVRATCYRLVKKAAQSEVKSAIAKGNIAYCSGYVCNVTGISRPGPF